MVGDDQPDAGDGQAGRPGVAERLVVPLKPGNAGGGKGPQFKTNAASSEGRWRLGNLATPMSVQKLQMALHAKAKAEAGLPLLRAVRQDQPRGHPGPCLGPVPLQPGRTGRGRSGLRGCRGVRRAAVARRTGACAQGGDVPTGPHQKSVHPEGQLARLRPLGISTLRDRVCMTAAMLVLEPIFEADLPPEQYAYRPGRNAQQAVIEVEETLFRGHPEVVDADLADYFGSIPHAELMLSLARRIVDRRVLHLIKMWLECAVEETDDRGRKTRTTEAKDQRRGIPQGSPISPLLANLYMRRFVLGWKKLGLEKSLGTRIVTYADDLVILCRKGKAEEALQRLRELMGKLKLTVNEEKTRICKVPEGEFDFLGYTFGRMYSPTTGKARLGMRPSKKSIRRMVEKIHALTATSKTVARDHGDGGQVEPHAARLGELLPSRHRQPRVPGARQLHRTAVAPVVAQQVQGQATQGRDLSTLAPLRALRARAPDRAWARRGVGEGVKSCPRAGCGRSACPVR